MTKKNPRAEMPFLDHLEELRWRILWSLLALVLGSVIGFWVVEHYDVLAILKRPIAGLLPGGKLFVTRPTDAFIITLKLAVLVGMVLASPVILWQAWAFLSPALYEREKRFVVPILIAGLFLFVGGVLMAYLWVLPTALKLLFAFQRPDLEFIITADEYFSFASLFVLAFGVVFELPLVIVLLAGFGVLHPDFFAKQRPTALVIAAIVAALLTPPDAVSMMMMLVPLMVLYELGILVARLVWRARVRGAERGVETAVLALLLVTGGAARAGAQQQAPVPPRRSPAQDSAAADSLRRGQAVDTAAARRLGLPAAPSRPFPAPDSMIAALLKRQGFRATRYAGDTLTLLAETREIVLAGSALVEREGSTLEADSVRFFQAECRLQASGTPKLFDRGTVLVGEGMRYDTCERRGIVARAFTKFNQSGVEWFLRGHLAVDSASSRIYAGSSSITSSDLPLPDYHFAAGEIKWVSNTIMVARPAILYVRDVPVLWMPFIFQDMRQGRRSGLLVPNFGINDLVRPNRGYRRHLTNLGFYAALNDYVDARASLDWYAGTLVQVNGELRYRWLDRFIRGQLGLSRMWQLGQAGAGGSRSLQIQLNHDQQFDQRTRLNANVNYVTQANILQRNSVDPTLATASLVSAATFNKQASWGSLQLGGRRTQELSSGLIQQTLPGVSLTPKPVDLAPGITWSPSFNLNSSQVLNQRGSVLDLPPVAGLPRQDTLRFGSRTTTLSMGTPLRIGSWTWGNDVNLRDDRSEQRRILRLPDPENPADSLTRIYGETFATGLDWNTGIGLPVLFPSTWRLAPQIGIQNASAGGPFLLRNQYTGGQWVHQGKRLSFSAAISPTLFGFFPGIGPLMRIRHAVSPRVEWHYAPASSVSEAYARALDPSGAAANRRTDPLHTLQVSLAQTFEAKLQPPPGDSAAALNPRKIKLLSLQTSAIGYDFEQAKKPGRRGWTTQTVTNTLTSDLLPGFTLTTVHDLWEGAAGSDTARFAPFLSSVSTRFSLSANTFARALALIAGRPAPAPGPVTGTAPPPLGPALPQPGTTIGVRSADQVTAGASGARGLTMSVGYDEQRTRGSAAAAAPGSPGGTSRTVNFSTKFAPTRNWAVSWDTQYNFTTGEFGQHTLRLERDMRRWRATFSFLKSPNGNFAFNFHIVLLDQPDIKFQYDQQTVGGR